MSVDLQEFNRRAQTQRKENEEFYRKLKTRPPKNLDRLFHDSHEKVFEKLTV